MNNSVLSLKKLDEKDIELNKQEFIKYLTDLKIEGMDNLIKFLCDSDFFVAPAASSHHSNYRGGLCEHSLKVLRNLDIINTQKKLNLSNKTIIITSLLHDLCKINCYDIEKKFTKVEGCKDWITYYTYSFKDRWGLGHGEASIFLVQKYIELSLEEANMIRWHMGAYNMNPSDLRNFDNARNQYKGVTALHLADIMASSFDEIEIKHMPTSLDDLK